MTDPGWQLRLEDIRDWAERGLTDDLDDIDVEGVVKILHEVRKARYALVLAESQLEEFIVDVAHWKTTEIEGVGYVEIKPATKRTAWDHDELWRKVVAVAVAAREPNADGEIEEPLSAALRALQECAGVGYWKVTGLRQMGFDPDEYCEKSYGPRKVVFLDAA